MNAKKVSGLGMLFAALPTLYGFLPLETEALKITGDYQVQIHEQTFQIAPPEVITVKDEYYPSLPEFAPLWGWNDGVALIQVRAAECTLSGALIPESVVVTSPDHGTVYEAGKDYNFNPEWGSLGRIKDGAIRGDQPVIIDYQYVPMRLDSIVRTSDGALEYRKGIGRCACPPLPALKEGEDRLVNIFLEPSTQKLEMDNFYFVEKPFPVAEDARKMQKFLPKTMEILRNGGTLRILAWGDSVTEGAYLPREERWHEMVLRRLQAAYPNVKIVMQENHWGGRTMQNFLNEPASSPRNFAEKIAGAEVDLVISEFVNDASLPDGSWDAYVPELLRQFRENQVEWLITTPHYTWTKWMGYSGQNGEAMLQDPRPYTSYIRKFAADNQIALADTSKLYGQLYLSGIPYITLMTNNINHPDKTGMTLYADAIMAVLAPEEEE